MHEIKNLLFESLMFKIIRLPYKMCVLREGERGGGKEGERKLSFITAKTIKIKQLLNKIQQL